MVSFDYPPPQPTNFNDVIITLERTGCYGTCPIYELTISGDGNVTYKGEGFVNVTGTHTAQITQEEVKELIDEFYKIEYFSLKDSYEEYRVTDMPSTITSITINGRTKTVRHYHGDKNAPKELTELERKIDEITNSKQWVEGE